MNHPPDLNVLEDSTVQGALCTVPDIFVLMNVGLMELLRKQFIIHSSQITNHLHSNKSRKNGHHQAFLTQNDFSIPQRLHIYDL